MRSGIRSVVPAVVVALLVTLAAACSGDGGTGNVDAFCNQAKKNSDTLNRPALGVGVDNQSILESHVTAMEELDEKAPTEISDQTSYIADKEKAFLDEWRAGGFKSNTMPEFDEGLGAQYKELSTFLSEKCQVTIST